jgi:hypothetical protein
MNDKMSEQHPPMPPATFEFLVLSLRFQAEAQLGLMSWGDEAPTVNLTAARHSIDLLAMLQDKTRNNLTTEEQRLIENTVTELRFRYLHVYEAEQKKHAAAAEASAEAAAAAKQAAPADSEAAAASPTAGPETATEAAPAPASETPQENG